MNESTTTSSQTFSENSIYLSGPNSVVGMLEVSGSKNAALPLLAATLLCTQGASELKNIPRLSDIQHILEAMISLGAHVSLDDKGSLHIDAKTCNNMPLIEDVCSKTRASILFLGPLLTRFGSVSIPKPGGCKIGSRPIDQHLEALRLMGAQVRSTDSHFHVSAQENTLYGTTISLKSPPSVTGTENIILAATLAKGTTTIINAAREPEIDDLVLFLCNMGARIQQNDKGHIVIHGQKELTGTKHTIIGDRLEAGTFLIAAAAAQGDLTVSGINSEHLRIVTDKLQQAGCIITTTTNSIRIQCTQTVRATSIQTQPFPGFPTDLQPQWMTLMSLADGTSIIEENIFENRFQHVASLQAMGARIQINSHRQATIHGVDKLRGRCVHASDIRAAAALLIAGMVAHGNTCIENAHYIDRGHEDLAEKCKKIGLLLYRTHKH